MTTEDSRAGVLGPILDKAVTIPSRDIHRRVDKLRKKHPHASPADIVERLTKSYMRKVSRFGGGVGAVAAVPAVGTLAAMGLTGAQLTEFVYDSAAYVMAVADVHGVPADDVERRRTLLLASLLGEEGAQAVQTQLGVGTLYWGRALLTKLPVGTVKAVNKRLQKQALKRGAQAGGRAVFGRLMPFGIGAVIGYLGGRSMGNDVTKGVADAFGPAPATFARRVGEISRKATVEFADA